MDSINIPHGDYIRFIKEIIELKKDGIVALCKFNKSPTLAMLVEASAQTAATYMTSKDDRGLLGFLVGVRRFVLQKKDIPKDLFIDLKINSSLDEMYYATVIIISNDIEIGKGELSFYLTKNL